MNDKERQATFGVLLLFGLIVGVLVLVTIVVLWVRWLF